MGSRWGARGSRADSRRKTRGSRPNRPSRVRRGMGTYFASRGENNARHDGIGKTGENDTRCGIFEDDGIPFLRQRAMETALGEKLCLCVKGE